MTESGPPPSVRPPPVSMPTAEGAPPAEAFDVVVIGGGINGTGVARDLALRGLKPVAGSAAVIPARMSVFSPRFSDHDFIMCRIEVH